MEICHQLNFNLHIRNICESPVNEMSAMIIKKGTEALTPGNL